MKDPVEVCPFSRRDDLEADTPTLSIPIRSITERHLLFPRSYTRLSIGKPCGLLSLVGRNTGLPCSI
ncbi:MAG: hypothetical protein ACHQYP_09215 [Nitrospiria bacterium]